MTPSHTKAATAQSQRRKRKFIVSIVGCCTSCYEGHLVDGSGSRGTPRMRLSVLASYRAPRRRIGDRIRLRWEAGGLFLMRVPPSLRVGCCLGTRFALAVYLPLNGFNSSSMSVETRPRFGSEVSDDKLIADSRCL